MEFLQLLNNLSFKNLEFNKLLAIVLTKLMT
jgi:hypothetical protein